MLRLKTQKKKKNQGESGHMVTEILIKTNKMKQNKTKSRGDEESDKTEYLFFFPRTSVDQKRGIRVLVQLP